jgi:outer membrane protein TolC
MRAILMLFAAGLSAGGQTVLSLRDALDSAARQNPSIQLARLQALEAELNAQIVRSAYLPQAQLAVNTSYQTANLQGIGLVIPGFSGRLGPFRTFNARPALTQTVLDASLISEIRAAREQTRQLKFEAAAARESILYASLQLYLQALEAGSRLEAAEARVRTAEAIVAQIAEREQGGLASKLDVSRAQQQRQDEIVTAENARRDREVLKAVLLRTIGGEQSSGGLELAPVADARRAPDFDSALARGLAGRPEAGALEARLAADNQRIQAAGRARLPKVSAVADWGLSGAGPDRAIGTYNAGVAVTLPLWTGKRIESEQAASRLRADQTAQGLVDLKLQIRQEVRQAQIESESAQRSLVAASRSTSAARETLELTRLRYGSGLATSLDTTVAQNSLAQAEEQEIRIRYQGLLALARLARASGDVYSFFGDEP